jgi:hypothetical protein
VRSPRRLILTSVLALSSSATRPSTTFRHTLIMMLRHPLSLSVLLIAILIAPLQTAAIKFALPASKNPVQKCIWNAAHDGALVVITANLGPGENQRVDIEVVDRSEHRHMYLSKKGLRTETRVAITAHGEGDVGICFTNTLTGSKSKSFRVGGIVTHAFV